MAAVRSREEAPPRSEAQPVRTDPSGPRKTAFQQICHKNSGRKCKDRDQIIPCPAPIHFRKICRKQNDISRLCIGKNSAAEQVCIDIQKTAYQSKNCRHPKCLMGRKLCSLPILFNGLHFQAAFQYLQASHSVRKSLLLFSILPVSDKTVRSGYCCLSDPFHMGMVAPAGVITSPASFAFATIAFAQPSIASKEMKYPPLRCDPGADL